MHTQVDVPKKSSDSLVVMTALNGCQKVVADYDQRHMRNLRGKVSCRAVGQSKEPLAVGEKDRFFR